MAFANNINRDMTAADARAVAGQSSWSDIYPDDFDPDSDPWEFLGDHRLYFDTAGEPHFAVGKNPFSGDLAQVLERSEKDGLLARKAAGGLSGAIRDTRSRNGEPKQWDHLIVGLTRAEADALGPDGVKDWAKTVIRSMQDSPEGDGKRQMLVTPIHDDTDNVHLQFLIHRIPVNETNNTVGASYELSRNSQAAGQMKQINTALEEAGLPMISDFRMGAFSVSEPRAVSAEEMSRGAERIKEAGGVTPPDLTTGPLQALPARERVSPEMRHLDGLLADAVKRQKEVEAQATAAATMVAAAQHAKAALEQYEAEVKVRESVEAALAESAASVERMDAEIKENAERMDQLNKLLDAANALGEDLKERLENATQEVATLTDDLASETAHREQAEGLASKRAEQIETLSGEVQNLTSERDDLTGKLEAEKSAVASLEDALIQKSEEAKAHANDAAALREQLATMTAERDRLGVSLKEAENKVLQSNSALELERASFPERARAWAEEHVAGPLRAEMAQLRETFGKQIEALTAAITNRGQQAQQRPQQQVPDYIKKDPSEWTRNDRQAAEAAFKRVQDGGKFQNATVDEWGASQNKAWKKRNPNEGGSGPASGNAPRQPS